MKKVIALTLAVSLALGMATVALAATPEINTFKGWFQTDTDAANAAHTYIYSISSITPPSPVPNPSEDLDEIAPGHVAYFYLSGASFDLPADEATRLTTSVLDNRQNGISLKMRARRGGDVIESVSWRNVTKEVTDSANLVIPGATGNAQYPYGIIEVKVEFIDHFVSTGEKEFDIEIYLSKSDWDPDESAIQLTGTLYPTPPTPSGGSSRSSGNGGSNVSTAASVLPVAPADQTWTGEPEGLPFTVEGVGLPSLLSVAVDGEVLSPSLYELRAGSVIVTLHADYLRSLSTGEHTLRLQFWNSTATATFSVQPAGTGGADAPAQTGADSGGAVNDNPSTGGPQQDGGAVWLLALLVAGGALCAGRRVG